MRKTFRVITIVVAAAGVLGAGTWTAPRTPWGDPDLQGIWDGRSMTPLQRPEKFRDREYLTEEEAAAMEKEAAAAPGRNARGKSGTVEDLEGAYNEIFNSRVTNLVRTRRTSLIVDPPDGKLPALTAEGQLSKAAFERTFEGQQRTTLRGQYVVELNRDRADNPEDLRTLERCFGVMLPETGPLVRIVQSPGLVAMYYERGNAGGAYRMIHVDGRPHLSLRSRQWFGDSVGRWEGDTLVVDTINFTDKVYFQGSRENLHLIERFTRTTRDMILYRATIEDSTTFTRPWTIEVPLIERDNKANQIFETACHEGNYSMPSILAGARALEKEHAAGRVRHK